MPRSFFHKAFDKWMAANRARFNHQPQIKIRRQGYIEMNFQGVTPKISACITKSGVDIAVHHKGTCVDLLITWDLVVRRDNNRRYFCELCSEPDMHASRQALWDKHCFEPLLHWANQELRSDQQLSIHILPSGSSRAVLRPQGSTVTDEGLAGQIGYQEVWPVVKINK